VVLSLSLGIGVNTALFSIIDVLMLRALPVSRPAELFLLRSDGPRAVPVFSYPQFQGLRDAAPPSGGVAAMSRVARMYGRVDGESGRQPLTLQLVSGEYFRCWVSRLRSDAC
jgi:putative ABC transport system permease protein